MEYTVEERREAFEKKMLWWRYPSDPTGDTGWTLMHTDVGQFIKYPSVKPEYFIGKVSPDGDVPECMTLEQKALALIQGKLWYRLPNSDYKCNRMWTRITEKLYEHMICPDAEYFIGDSPYQFSETEKIMFDALETIKGHTGNDAVKRITIDAIEEVLNIKIQKS